MNRRRGAGAYPRRRRRWAIVALLAAGWFLHDATLRAALATLGVNALIGMEFSLPDLSRQRILPDRPTQAFALLFPWLLLLGRWRSACDSWLKRNRMTRISSLVASE